jgi:hypothetical protein
LECLFRKVFINLTARTHWLLVKFPEHHYTDQKNELIFIDLECVRDIAMPILNILPSTGKYVWFDSLVFQN